MPDELTPDEMALINKLADCWGDFRRLPHQHPSDPDDFVFHVHALQRMVMVREVRRHYPDVFHGGTSIPFKEEKTKS